jgi:membrane protease YdiL (CAAX protease family)
MTGLTAKLRWVFFGSDGIRAGWSALIFLVLIAIPAVILGLILKRLHIGRGGDLQPWRTLIAEGVSFAIIMGATAVMARIEGRSVWSYGLSMTRMGRLILAGLAGGFISLSLLVGALDATGYLMFDGMSLHGLSILGYGLVWLMAFVMVGCSEEAIFRGYLQSTLARGMGFWPGALVLSLLFGAVHISNHGESVLGIAEVVAAGLILCLLLRLSGSLWLSIGFHAAWDWSQSFLYGTPDSGYLAQKHFLDSHAVGNALISGGSAGPEGSALSPVVMAAGMLLVLAACRWAGLVGENRIARRGVALGGVKQMTGSLGG